MAPPNQDAPPGFGPPASDPPTGFGPAVDTYSQPETGSTASANLFGSGGNAPPPGILSRFGQAVGVPTSADEAQQMMDQLNLIHSTKHPVAAKIGNLLLGPTGTAAALAKDYGKNLYDRAVEPLSPDEQTQFNAHPILGSVDQGMKYILRGPLGPFGGEAVNSFAEDAGAGKLAPAAGDLLGVVANLLMLKHGMGPSNDARLNALTHATGDKGALQYENLLSSLEQTRAQSRINVRTVGDVRDVVNKFKDNVNTEYGNALGPVANRQTIPMSIGQRIRALETPDMDYTAEGQAERRAIENAAVEYEKPWTFGALDSKRSRLAADLASHNAKEPVARYTAERGSINVAIDNAVLDALRDTVYPQADQIAGKPTGYFEGLKQKQSDAIRLQQLLNRSIDNMRDASRGSKGTPAMARLHGGAVLSTTGAAPHGYISGLPRMLHAPDVLTEANNAAANGLGTGGPVNRIVQPISESLLMSYPARFLALSSQPMTPAPNTPSQ